MKYKERKMKEFVIVDLEATCYDGKDKSKPTWFKNEIIEIGAVKLDSNGVEIGRFCEFLYPKNHPVISKFCNELTTITQEDINESRSAKDVLVDFFEWVGDATLISWGFYDRSQFQLDLSDNELYHLIDKTEYHYSLKHLHGEWNGLRRSIGLGKALSFEKLEFDGTPHRGIDDAVNIAKIFRKYINKF